MRLHRGPVRRATSVFLFEILANKHSRECYPRFSPLQEGWFSRHRVSKLETRDFLFPSIKNTAVCFSLKPFCYASGERGLMRSTTSASNQLSPADPASSSPCRSCTTVALTALGQYRLVLLDSVRVVTRLLRGRHPGGESTATTRTQNSRSPCYIEPHPVCGL